MPEFLLKSKPADDEFLLGGAHTTWKSKPHKHKHKHKHKQKQKKKKVKKGKCRLVKQLFLVSNRKGMIVALFMTMMYWLSQSEKELLRGFRSDRAALLGSFADLPSAGTSRPRCRRSATGVRPQRKRTRGRSSRPKTRLSVCG
jgi:hypothetical protein